MRQPIKAPQFNRVKEYHQRNSKKKTIKKGRNVALVLLNLTSRDLMSPSLSLLCVTERPACGSGWSQTVSATASLRLSHPAVCAATNWRDIASLHSDELVSCLNWIAHDEKHIRHLHQRVARCQRLFYGSFCGTSSAETAARAGRQGFFEITVRWSGKI